MPPDPPSLVSLCKLHIYVTPPSKNHGYRHQLETESMHEYIVQVMA